MISSLSTRSFFSFNEKKKINIERLFNFGKQSFFYCFTIIFLSLFFITTVKAETSENLQNLIEFEYIPVFDCDIDKNSGIKTNCEIIKEDILYSYITSKQVLFDDDEIPHERTENTQTFVNNDGSLTKKVFSGDVFYHDENDNWLEISQATTTLEDFDLEMRQIEILDSLTFWKTREAIAEATSSARSISGDGGMTCLQGWNTFETCHDSLSGYAVSYTRADLGDNGFGASAGMYKYNNLFTFQRTFLPFDTSDFEEDITITNASINIYADYGRSVGVDDRDNVCYSVLVESTQADQYTLIADDFDQVGHVSFGVSERYDLIGDSSWWSIDINQAGIDIIDTTGFTKYALRNKGDFDNYSTQQSGDVFACYTQSRSYEYFGIDYDPYLLITYELGSVTPTTTVVLPTDFPYQENVQIISGVMYTYNLETGTSTPAETSIFYFQIPFFLLIFILFLFSFCIGLVSVYFFYIKRNYKTR